MRKFSRAISVSFIVHLVILVMIIGGVIFLKSDSGGSGGSDGAIVSVWLAGPGGHIISGRKTPHKKQSTRTKRRSNKSSRAKTNKNGLMANKSAKNARKSMGSAGMGKSAGVGTGIGSGVGKAVGTGTGEGIGQGSGGNATLTLIWKKINRAKYYPTMAKKLRLEGTPRVSFSIKKDGGNRMGSVGLFM